MIKKILVLIAFIPLYVNAEISGERLSNKTQNINGYDVELSSIEHDFLMRLSHVDEDLLLINSGLVNAKSKTIDNVLWEGAMVAELVGRMVSQVKENFQTGGSSYFSKFMKMKMDKYKDAGCVFDIGKTNCLGDEITMISNPSPVITDIEFMDMKKMESTVDGILIQSGLAD